MNQTVLAPQGNESASYSASVSFILSDGTGDSGCITGQHGPCSLSHCGGGTSTYQFVSAGVVTASAGEHTLSLAPNADHTYTPITGAGRVWNAGQPLEVRADGDTVPAFFTLLDGVDPVLVTAPEYPAPGTPLTVDRGTDLAVAWEYGGAGRVIVILATTTNSGGTPESISLVCQYPASDGSAAIPSSLLAMLPTDGDGSISISGGDAREVAAGDWTVVVEEYVSALLPSGITTGSAATFK